MKISKLLKSTRRGFIKGAAIALGGVAGAGFLPDVARGEKSGMGRFGGINPPRKLNPAGGLKVILLGTGTPLPNSERACACVAVIAGDRVFLVDTGRGCVERISEAGLRNFDGVLFTHFHSDHFGEFGEVVITDAILGRARPLKVFGPTGAKDVIGNMMDSYKPDIGFRKLHHKEKWSDAATSVEITEKNEGVVIDDGGLKVIAFLVKHTPVEPALGYRFEFRGKSAVISGDTVPLPEMAKIAEKADLLVHEAINKKLLNRFRDNVTAQGGERLGKMMDEMMEYHSDVSDVAEIAARAEVSMLALTHLVPSIPPNKIAEKLFVGGAKKKFKGEIVVGQDLMEIEV